MTGTIMTLSNHDIEQAAARIREAERSGVACLPLTPDYPGCTTADAYAVQEANTVHAIAAGRKLAGRKIGLTSRAVQAQLGVDQPDFGVLFADMAIADGEEVSYSRLLQPKLEGEIAFVLGKTLDSSDITLTSVIDAVEYCLPAIEIVDSRIADWKIGIFDTIADNASSGLYVLGTTPRRIAQVDLRLCGMVVEHRGEAVSTGAGLACLGNPLNATLWLARKMIEVGRPLGEGDTILSGALGPMVAAERGEVYEVRINGLGSVRAIMSR
ncbi:2-oxopent-4-enoate hydratase (plasmid) [Sphingobium sp. AntQ-1]|uniref:2-keto-4-pentenoate hydratase n=1 Tax=Sphingobium sp. AntQ-1 TaxID=2930091 RepID=UPI00234E53C7|nr:fumarylacetoacetate hydrolase family protein [Sphingobium sp. AntQ-1]WCP15977.1 2-oxopent-4-enoate hydratase [Sphingobium sp. AntQ-1]